MNSVTSADSANMMLDATNLTEIYAPLKLSVSVALPSGGTWYRADTGAVITELPQGLTETVRLYKSSAVADDSSDDDSSDDDSSDSSSSSSSSSSNSTEDDGTGEVSLSSAVAGQAVKTATVPVTVLSADGTATASTLDTVIASVQTFIESAAAVVEQAVIAVQSIMTTAPTEFFTQTVEALAEMKGGEVIVNDCGTVKTAATAVDAYGNNIASAGVVENVTTGSLVMLMGVNADGTVEYVEGVVDPVTGVVMGIFKELPVTITVLVFA